MYNKKYSRKIIKLERAAQDKTMAFGVFPKTNKPGKLGGRMIITMECGHQKIQRFDRTRDTGRAICEECAEQDGVTLW